MSTEPRFIQIHTLHTYPAALINRDDAGLAKRLPLGNAVRTRISSQCLKRHWRITDDPFALSVLNVPMAIRSRWTLDQIRKAIVENKVPQNLAQAATEALRDGGLLDTAGKGRKGQDALQTGQAVLMGKTEIDYLVRKCTKLAQDIDAQSIRKIVETALDYLKKERSNAGTKKKKITVDAIRNAMDGDDFSKEWARAAAESLQDQGLLEKDTVGESDDEVIDKLSDRCAEIALRARIATMLTDEKADIRALKHGSGLESALFGRMVTSDVLASRDAAVYVAHAFTVHQAQVENDYFTVVDDLLQESGEQGSAGIFDTELASGLYYGYVVIDVRQLVENLEGIEAKDCFADKIPPDRRELAGRVVKHLLHLIATVSPGAKRGSTAPFDWAKFVLVEAGDWQPRSLAGAFHDALPLSVHNDSKTIRERAVERLTTEIVAMDDAYGAPLARRFLALDPVEMPKAERTTLSKLAEWAADSVKQGVC